VGFYDGPNFKLTKSSKEHTGFVNCNKFSPDGKHIISVSSDKSVVIYEAEKFEKVNQIA
jgi:WD repeat-containing protein 1 (actin-interacting protein 1)